MTGLLFNLIWQRLLVPCMALAAFAMSGGLAQAQVISVQEFDCGGVATNALSVGDVISVTHSINQTANRASAIVRSPPNQLYSAVLFQNYIANVPVTISYTLTTTPVTGQARFAVQFFNNNVLVDCPTYSATIAKAVSSTTVTAAGTVINYTITVQNTGTGRLDLPNLSDDFRFNGTPATLTTGPTLTAGDIDLDGDLDVGETWTYSASYLVSQTDMDTGGSFTNDADFSATYLSAITSNTTTTTITTTPSLTIVKTADQTNNVPAGTLITYTYDVTNNGNITIDNVTIADSHNASGPVPSPASESLLNDAGTTGDSFDVGAGDGNWSTLAPGDTIRMTATYTVTQNDVETLQ